MEPEYDSTSTVDTATSERRAVFWGGQLVYDIDLWGFDGDLKVKWDENAAKTILSTISNGSGLILLKKLVQISEDSHQFFIKNGVFELLSNEILSENTDEHIIGAAEALYYLVVHLQNRNDNPSYYAKIVLNYALNEKLILIMLHCKLLDVQKHVIRTLIKIWNSFGIGKKLCTEQYKIGMVYIWGLEKYVFMIAPRFLTTEDEDERVQLESLCFSMLKLTYNMMYKFVQYSNVKRIIALLMLVAFLYSFTGLERVWFVIQGCIDLAHDHLSSMQRYVCVYWLFDGFKSSDKQTQAWAAKGLWHIIRNTSDNEELTKIFNPNVVETMFGLVDISDDCLKWLLKCAQKLSKIKTSILRSIIPLIEQLLTKPDIYPTSISLGLQFIEKIFNQRNGYQFLHKRQLVGKLVEYGTDAVLSRGIIKVLEARGWDTSDLLSDSGISTTVSIKDD